MTIKPSDVYSSSYGFEIDNDLFRAFLDENKIELQKIRFEKAYYLCFSFPNLVNPDERPFVKNIGNGGLIARRILSRYMKEDIDTFLFDFFKKFKSLNSIINMEYENIKKKYGMFYLSDNFKNLYDINNFQITYETSQKYGRKTRRNLDMFLTISFDGKTIFKFDEDEINITIDYNNPDLFFHQLIEWHKAAFCKKLNIDKKETAENIYTLYDMMSY
jgi:hypothetical protein